MTPPPHGRGGGHGGGGALGRRAYASLLAAAVVALALLCLFYGAAFAPSIRSAHPRLPVRRLGFRRARAARALPAGLALSSIPVRGAAARLALAPHPRAALRFDRKWSRDGRPLVSCRCATRGTRS